MIYTNLLEAPVKAPWSEPGVANGSLLVAYPTSIGGYPYGGRIIPLLEGYAATNPSEKAICVVLGEISESQYKTSNRLALRPDLTRHMGAFVTFGRSMSREPSHYAIDMREYAKANPDFVGAEIYGDHNTTIDLQWNLKPFALQAVRLVLDKDSCTLTTEG